MAKAKLHGLLVDRQQVEGRNYVVSDVPEGETGTGAPHREMTMEEWEAKYPHPAQ